MRGMHDRTVDLGGPVHYEDHGGDGPPIVLVHGLGGATINWMSVAPALSRYGRVLALDLIGCGRTPRSDRSATISADRDLVERFVREVAGAPSLVVGNSRGGLVSMVAAAANPESVAGLVLVDPALPQWPDVIDPLVASMFATYASPGVGEEYLRTWQETMGPRGMVEQMLMLTFADHSRATEELRRAHVDLQIERADTEGLIEGFLTAARSLLEVLMDPEGWRRNLFAVRCPTLLVHGSEDRLVSVVAARELAKLRPDWTYRELAGLGHVPMMEDPEGFVRVVEDWLDVPIGAAVEAARRAPSPIVETTRT